MASEGLSAKQTLLVLLASAITVLLSKVGVYAWNSSYGLAIIYLAIAVALSLIFFWNRKLVLLIFGLVFIVVNVGLTAIFHPSLLAFLVTGACAGALYWIARWHAAKYPNSTRKDLNKFFDGELP